MEIIEKINPWIPKDSNNIKRYYIDFKSGRKEWLHPNVFERHNLQVGSEISNLDALLHENEFQWKVAYSKNNAWEKEKIRINAVENFIINHNPNLSVKIVGFGANSTQAIFEHTPEHGAPDLEILNSNNEVVAKVEVTGSEKKRGNDYWIRPDKIEYIKNHRDVPVIITLHYQLPEEVIVPIKINPDKEYQTVNKVIRENTETFVVFDDDSSEVMSINKFISDIKNWG